MQIKISTNFPQIQRQLETMRQDIADKAVASALNKTVAQAKTAMSREIRREFNISTQAVNDALRIRRATAVRARLQLEASLESRSKRGRSLNLINFLERSVSMAAARQRIKGGEGGFRPRQASPSREPSRDPRCDPSRDSESRPESRFVRATL